MHCNINDLHSSSCTNFCKSHMTFLKRFPSVNYLLKPSATNAKLLQGGGKEMYIHTNIGKIQKLRDKKKVVLSVYTWTWKSWYSIQLNLLVQGRNTETVTNVGLFSRISRLYLRSPTHIVGQLKRSHRFQKFSKFQFDSNLIKTIYLRKKAEETNSTLSRDK